MPASAPGASAGVPARAHDPARVPVGWTADGVDRRAVTAALDKRQAGWDVMNLDVDANADMIPWLHSLVTDDEFGHAVAECRRRHERQQASSCQWRQDIVLRRSAGGEATVAAVRARVTPALVDEEAGDTPPTPACRRFARCVAEAWRGRPGMFPEGADAYAHVTPDGDAYLALTVPVHHLDAGGLDPAAYRRAYERRLATIEERIGKREGALAAAEDEGVRSRRALDAMYYSLLLERGWTRDYRLYLRHLREHAP